MTEQEKPLHVRVAEALGCKPDCKVYGRHEIWSCTCQPRPVHDRDGMDGAPYEGREIEAYDTDWSATGPLVEEYGISLEKDGNAWIAGSEDDWTFSDDCYTPLLAICHLILALKEAGKL